MLWAILVATPLATKPARAAELAPHISWQAPPACPDAAAVSQRLETVLGSELLEYGRGWQLEGRVRGNGTSGWELVLELREPGRAATLAPLQRLLRAPHCEDLVEAAAVAIAIALGDAREGDLHAAPETASSPPAVGSQESVAPNATDPQLGAASSSAAAPPALRRSLDLSLEALLDSASVGSAALGGSLSVAAWFGALGVDVHGAWLPAQRESIAPEQSADFSLLTAGARGCYRVWGSVGSFGLAPCAGFEFGRFSAESQGLVSATRTHDLWLAPSLGVDLRTSLLGPLAARSRIEVLLPLRRQEYRVDLVQSVHEIPALTVRWSVGIDADVPLP